jgi:hypothetical protein
VAIESAKAVLKKQSAENRVIKGSFKIFIFSSKKNLDSAVVVAGNLIVLLKDGHGANTLAVF